MAQHWKPFTWSQPGVQKGRDNEVQEVEFGTELTFSSHRVNFLLSLVAWVMKTQRKLSQFQMFDTECIWLSATSTCEWIQFLYLSNNMIWPCSSLSCRNLEYNPSTPFCHPSCWPTHCWTVFWHILEQFRGCCHLCQPLVFPRGYYCTRIMEVPNSFQTPPYHDICTEMAARNITLPPDTTQGTPLLSLPLPARSVLLQA